VSENDWETQGSHSKWIVVDDNRGILQVISTMMELLTDAEILCFESAEDALKAFEIQPEEVSLVITDLEMPGMNGLELCHAIRAIRRDAKVVLMTGNHTAMDTASARLIGFAALLYKPFLPVDLRNLLDSVGVLNGHSSNCEQSYARPR